MKNYRSPSSSECHSGPLSTSLYSFVPSGLSNYPQSGLVQGSDGNFYGTTYESGTGLRGTAFKLAASLPSPANQMNGISVAGADVVITVAAVAGETYQLQSATDLTAGDWSNVTGVAVTNFGGALSPGRYYRFAIVP